MSQRAAVVGRGLIAALRYKQQQPTSGLILAPYALLAAHTLQSSSVMAPYSMAAVLPPGVGSAGGCPGRFECISCVEARLLIDGGGTAVCGAASWAARGVILNPCGAARCTGGATSSSRSIPPPLCPHARPHTAQPSARAPPAARATTRPRRTPAAAAAPSRRPRQRTARWRGCARWRGRSTATSRCATSWQPTRARTTRCCCRTRRRSCHLSTRCVSWAVVGRCACAGGVVALVS
jgi:hypothetical protein